MQFKVIKFAYDILYDEDKRAVYDTLGEDGLQDMVKAEPEGTGEMSNCQERRSVLQLLLPLLLLLPSFAQPNSGKKVNVGEVILYEIVCYETDVATSRPMDTWLLIFSSTCHKKVMLVWICAQFLSK